MYSAHPKLVKPSNSRQPLWRYLSHQRLCDLLRSEELFFTHLPGFSDGREGSLTEKTRERVYDFWHVQQRLEPKIAWGHVAEYEKLQEQFYVNCWHMNNVESYLMWKAYADRGCAIQTNFDRLQAAFDKFPGVISGGVVRYVDFSRDSTAFGNVFDHPITKDLPYRDEREFRLLFWRADSKNQDLKLEPKGIRVRVEVKMMIESVYVNPFESTTSTDLEELLERHGIPATRSHIRHRSPK